MPVVFFSLPRNQEPLLGYSKKPMRLFQPKFSKASFSQSGEDLIVEFIFNSLNIPVPTYIDIGAYHPYRLNNTAHFYQNGCRGINIEPNSHLFQVLKKVRPKDINLNIGIGDTQGNADFYILSSPTLSTFSKDKAEWYVGEHEQRMKEIRQMPVDTLPNIIARYSKGIFPDFLSLDIEGLDFEILQSIDYSGSIPIVICAV